jgi:hypothetical protein
MGIYKNVMELLVEDEVSRQYEALPPRMASYVNPTELVAYALNQLPALYATSEQGLEYQLKRGKEKYRRQIVQAVQRALAAVSRDPLRSSSPLQDQFSLSAPLREVLHQLRLLLRNDKVNWENLPNAVEHAIARAAKSGMNWDGKRKDRSLPTSLSQSPSSSDYPLSSPPLPRINIPTHNPRASSGSVDSFGWDNPLYDSH